MVKPGHSIGPPWKLGEKRAREASLNRLTEALNVTSFFGAFMPAIQPEIKKIAVQFDLENDLASIDGKKRGVLMEEIGKAQLYMQPAWKALKFITKLRFLEYKGGGVFHLVQDEIDWNADRPKYIAVSYCWKRKNHEVDWRAEWGSKDKVVVIDKTRNQQNELQQTPARPDVLMRVAQFAQRRTDVGMNNYKIWIDQECINQSDREDKECGIQSMHYVYRGAAVTLVLLGNHARTHQELDTLKEETTNRVEGRADTYSKDHVRFLANSVASDEWFTRSWCTQEYLVSQADLLVFLVGYNGWNPDRRRMDAGDYNFGFTDFRWIAPSLRRSGLLGDPDGRDLWSQIYGLFDIPGPEINKSDYVVSGEEKQQEKPKPDPSRSFANLNFEMCSPVLSSLGAILDKMIREPVDRLAIVSNLSNYRWRLETKTVNQSGMSFSAALLALALFNGDTSFMFAHPAQRDWEVQWGKVSERSINQEIPRWLPHEQIPIYHLVQNAINKQLKPRYGPSCVLVNEHLVTGGLLWEVHPYLGFQDDNLAMEFTRLATKWKNDRDREVFHSCFVLLVYYLCTELPKKKGEGVSAIEERELLELIVPGVRMVNSPAELDSAVEDLMRISELGSEQLSRYFDESSNPWPNQYYPEALMWLYQAILMKQPVCIGSLEMCGHPVKALFDYTSQDHSEVSWQDGATDFVLTPSNELEYSFGCADVNFNPDSGIDMQASFSWRVKGIEAVNPQWVDEVKKIFEKSYGEQVGGNTYVRPGAGYTEIRTPEVKETRYQLLSTVGCLLPVTLSSSCLMYRTQDMKWGMERWGPERSLPMYFISPYSQDEQRSQTHRDGNVRTRVTGLGRGTS